MRAGCLLVIWGVIRQLKERKGINHARRGCKPPRLSGAGEGDSELEPSASAEQVTARMAQVAADRRHHRLTARVRRVMEAVA